MSKRLNVLSFAWWGKNSQHAPVHRWLAHRSPLVSSATDVSSDASISPKSRVVFCSLIADIFRLENNSHWLYLKIDSQWLLFSKRIISAMSEQKLHATSGKPTKYVSSFTHEFLLAKLPVPRLPVSRFPVPRLAVWLPCSLCLATSSWAIVQLPLV